MRYNRRQFLGQSIALPLALRGMAAAQASARLVMPSRQWVLLGTDIGQGIYRAPWNAVSGTLGPLELAIESYRPTYLARNPTLPVVYAVNEGTGPDAAISSFQLDAPAGALTLFNKVGAQGSGPCFVSVDPTGAMAFVADYTSGTFVAYRLSNLGTLAQAIGVFKYTQATHGPVSDRQDAAHIHCATVAPGDAYVLACDLGDDVILVFPIGPGRGDYVRVPLRVSARAGSGPRHLAFHPNGRWLYCVHELDCTIDLYDWRVERDAPVMRLRENSVVSTLPRGASLAGNTGCEIVVTDDGRFVYTCTRGVDEVVAFRVDQDTGLLTEMQRVSCGGKTPRFMGLDPTRHWLVCCNQGAPGSVTVLARDKVTGRLNAKAKVFQAPTPMFALWV
jgi:6-phosphogluconolactonase